VVVAAAIATKIANPLLAIPLALGSHFVLETVPHWNPHLNTEMKRFGKITKISTSIVTLDAFTALFSGLFISSLALPNLNHSATILVACLFGVIPDLIEAPYYFLQGRLGFLGTSKKENGFIAKVWIPLQKSIQSDVPPFPGLLTQLATTLAAFWWILG